MAATGATWFRLTQPDGTSFVGVIQGCGGVIAHPREIALGRLAAQKRLTVRGRPLGVYEPVPGRVCMYTDYSADGYGEPVYLDLASCSIEVVAQPGDQVPQ